MTRMFSLRADSCCCCFSFSSDSFRPVTSFAGTDSERCNKTFTFSCSSDIQPPSHYKILFFLLHRITIATTTERMTWHKSPVGDSMLTSFQIDILLNTVDSVLKCTSHSVRTYSWGQHILLRGPGHKSHVASTCGEKTHTMNTLSWQTDTASWTLMSLSVQNNSLPHTQLLSCQGFHVRFIEANLERKDLTT